MRFYNQQGANLQRTQLHESDNVCECCQTFEHGAAEFHHDDAVCPTCHTLCRCGCHRDPIRQGQDEA